MEFREKGMSNRQLASNCTTGKPYPLFGDGKYKITAKDIDVFSTRDMAIVGQSFGVIPTLIALGRQS